MLRVVVNGSQVTRNHIHLSMQIRRQLAVSYVAIGVGANLTRPELMISDTCGTIKPNTNHNFIVHMSSQEERILRSFQNIHCQHYKL
jgi:hypothetical protein